MLPPADHRDAFGGPVGSRPGLVWLLAFLGLGDGVPGNQYRCRDKQTKRN
jgi:hypothetical protein